MAKKILIISGSPRKGGNSDTLCDRFAEGVISAGNIAEKVFLHGKNIKYCTGCGSCYSKQGTCIQKDDAGEILDKMVDADVIVMATPVYFYTMSAQLKTLIDRACSRYLLMKNKEFYFIMTAAEHKPEMKRTLESLQGFTDCLDGAIEKGVIYGEGVYKVGEIKKSAAMQEAYDIGKTA